MYSISGTRGGLAGSPAGLRWRYYDPVKAPKQKLMKGWSDARRYCKEQLPWVEETWTPPATTLDTFQGKSKAFYDNVYGALTRGEALVVQPAEVRRQVAVLEECHRTNPLPKMKRPR